MAQAYSMYIATTHFKVEATEATVCIDSGYLEDFKLLKKTEPEGFVRDVGII